MAPDLFLDNLSSAPVLFFFLGCLAVLVRSGLDFPDPVPKMLALYLLFSIGFRGGVELRHSGAGQDILIVLGAAIAVAALTPVAAFFLLRRRLSLADAAAVAATYGSVSAVTFLTAIAFLKSQNVAFGGHMIAAMALMETPAIVMGLALHRLLSGGRTETPLRTVLHEAFFNSSVYLLLGSLAVGFLSGDRGREDLSLFYEGIFKGVLCFFLLEMGIVTMRQVRLLRRAGWFLPAFAVIFPLCAGMLGVGLSMLLGLREGDALLFAVLCGSASYIAVPAAFRLAVPEANPGIYVTPALGITFPLNLTLGIPLYFTFIRWMGS